MMELCADETIHPWSFVGANNHQGRAHILYNVCNGFHMAFLASISCPEDIHKAMVSWSETMSGHPSGNTGTKCIMIVDQTNALAPLRSVLAALVASPELQDKVGIHPQDCGPWSGHGAFKLPGEKAHLWIIRRSK